MTPKSEDLLASPHQVPRRVARAAASPQAGWELEFFRRPVAARVLRLSRTVPFTGRRSSPRPGTPHGQEKLMFFNHRAARALLAGLVFVTPVAVSAQSLAPSISTAPAESRSSTAASTAKAVSAKPSPQAQKSTARVTDAGANAHKSGQPPEQDEAPMIVVSVATRNAQAPDTTATDTTVVTQADLQAGNYLDVADALREVDGLAVVPTGTPGQVTSIFIHGADSNQTLFTIDGRPQPLGLDGAYDFTNLTLDNVAQIEVVKTPVASVQGGSASGGVINLVSLTGRGLDKPESSVSFEGGSFSTFRENIQSRGAEGKFDYAVSASDWSSDMDRPNENYRNDVYRGNFGYQATPDIYIDVHTGYSLANAGSPNTIETPDPEARLVSENYFISPEITAKVTDFYTTKAYFNHDQTRQNFDDPFNNIPAFTSPSNNLTQITTNEYDWQNNLQLAHNWQITAGIEGGSQQASLFDEVADSRTLQNSLSNIGGYAESQWQPIKGLNVINSVRYDSYSDYDGALTWRQAVSYRIAPTGTVVHASGSSSYTPPSAEDLYYPGASNPDLKPESTLGWEVGAKQPLLDGRLTPSATYFHNDTTNYILFTAPNFLPVNVGEVTTEGVDLDVAAKPIDELTLDLNYTYLTAENDSTDMRLVRRPRNSLNFNAIYTPVKPLTLSIGGSWVVGRQDYDPVTFDQDEAPDYFTLRASATYTINKNVTVWVRGENLTDAHYQPVLGYPALGVGGYGGIKVSF
jgi:vitamin B12 transporter